MCELCLYIYVQLRKRREPTVPCKSCSPQMEQVMNECSVLRQQLQQSEQRCNTLKSQCDTLQQKVNSMPILDLKYDSINQQTIHPKDLKITSFKDYVL